MLKFSVEKAWKSLWESCEKVLHSFRFSVKKAIVFHNVQKFSMVFSTIIYQRFPLLFKSFAHFPHSLLLLLNNI